VADDQEKTEEPTDKKIEDSRKEGNVPKSQEMTGLFTLFVAILGAVALFPLIAEQALSLTRHFFSMMGTELDRNLLLDLAFTMGKSVLLMVIPLAITVAIASVLGHFAQFGWNFTTKPLEPKFDKLNPIKGFANVFGLKKMLEGFKITAKASLSLGLGFYMFIGYVKELPTVALFNLGDQLDWMIEKAIMIALMMLMLTFVFALIDIVIVRKQYFDKLKMSMQEVKDEMKNMEGDPLIKGKIRQKQMEMASQRMMAEVPNADVVVTNPTHYAVAIKYDEKMIAPIVLAKGIDHKAVKIKEIARESGVHIIQNPPLARSLYRDVEVERPIPEELFAAVAEILAYVFKMDKESK